MAGGEGEGGLLAGGISTHRPKFVKWLLPVNRSALTECALVLPLSPRACRIDRSGWRCAAFGFFSWRYRSRLTPVFSPRVWTSQCWGSGRFLPSPARAGLLPCSRPVSRSRCLIPSRGRALLAFTPTIFSSPLPPAEALRLPSRAWLQEQSVRGSITWHPSRLCGCDGCYCTEIGILIQPKSV